MRSVKDRAGRDRGLQPALGAHPQTPRRGPRRAAATPGAGKPIRPTKPYQIVQAGSVIGEPRLELLIRARIVDPTQRPFRTHPSRLLHSSRDAGRMFTRLAKRGYTHHATRGYKATDLDAVMPGPHLVSSLLKRWIAGTLHYRLSHRHMPYYLDEFTYRFNRRNTRARGMLFYRLLQQAIDTDPHPLKELIRGY